MLREHFEPQKNCSHEVYRFIKATQESQETLDQLHTRLRSVAETCEFADVEFEIEQQMIIGGTSSKIRKNALRDPSYDLKAMLLEGRRDEQSTFHAKEIESKEEHLQKQTNQYCHLNKENAISSEDRFLVIKLAQQKEKIP